MEEKKIVDFLTELGAKNITLTSELRDDLGLDSLQMVILLIALEDIFEIELEEADIDPGLLVTVEDVISLTKKYTQPSEENTNE